MRVLFVTGHYPADFSTSVHGAFQRMRLWLDALQSLDADIEILFFPNSMPAEPDSGSAIAQQIGELWGVRCSVAICGQDPAEPAGQPRGLLAHYVSSYVRPALGMSRQVKFSGYAGNRQVEAFKHSLARSPDMIFFHSLHSVVPASSLSLGEARIYLDLPDVEHRQFTREVAQPPHWRSKPLQYLQVPALWWGERAAIVRANLVFVCSEVDKRYLQGTMRVRNVEVIPNAVARIADSPLTSEPNILFIGAYGYGPNVVAAEHLIREVFPRLKAICPRARLLIAGAQPSNVPSYHNPPDGVEFLGFVADLGALYRRTRVLCCAIQSGGGTRIKILEAASYGVPIVSTPVGAEGLDLVPEEEVVLRTDAGGLAGACADLIEDDVLARRIGVAARERVRSLYSRDVIIRRITAILAADRPVTDNTPP